jgi:hypothetical protein
MPDEIVSFGFEDFWPQASKEYADVFSVIARLIAVVNEALDAAEKKRSGCTGGFSTAISTAPRLWLHIYRERNDTLGAARIVALRIRGKH